MSTKWFLLIGIFIGLPLLGFGIGILIAKSGLAGILIITIAIIAIWRSPAALIGAFMAARRRR